MTTDIPSSTPSSTPSQPLFRNPNGSRRYLRGLFFEESIDKSSVLYTLKEQDHLGYPSLKRLYIEAGDLTEYTFATSYLEGWSHWVELSESDWFKPYIEAWRRELEVKIRSQALSSILEVARDKANSNTYHANKYLLEGSWKPAGELKRGRPSKEAIKAEIIAQAASKAEIEEDAKRLGLN